jgi:tRNA-modifying protein YgfZ
MSAALQRRDTVTVAGPDATAYLQGQVSADVDALAVGESSWTFVLEPTGKLGFLARVRRTADDSFRFDVDAGAGDELAGRLRRFLLRTKATVETGSLSVEVGSTTAGGETLVGWWDEGEHVVTDPAAEGADADAEAADAAEAQRIAAGWPAHGHELVDGVIPGETGVVQLAVSFTKGCYTGQELVSRIDSRGGNAPRPIRGLRIDGEIAVGAAVTADDGHALGVVTSAVSAPDLDGTLALAPLARAVAPPAAVVVDGRPARLVELPMP